MRIEPCLGALLSWKRKRVTREGASFSFDFFLSLSFSHNAHDFSASASLSPPYSNSTRTMGTFHLVCTPLSIVEQLCLDGTGDDERRQTLSWDSKSVSKEIERSRAVVVAALLLPAVFPRRCCCSVSLSNSAQAARACALRARRLRECIRRANERRRSTSVVGRRRRRCHQRPRHHARCVSPRSDALFLVRTLIRCDLSHVVHETFDAVAQRTSLAEASRAGRSTPPPESTFAKVIGGSRAITLFFPSFFRSHFFPLFQPLPTFFHSTGKVHGSLARAGKVRGQTPKVAKQDKKKLPKVSFLVLFPFLASLRRAPPLPPTSKKKNRRSPCLRFLPLSPPSLPSPPPPPPQKTQ